MHIPHHHLPRGEFQELLPVTLLIIKNNSHLQFWGTKPFNVQLLIYPNGFCSFSNLKKQHILDIYMRFRLQFCFWNNNQAVHTDQCPNHNPKVKAKSWKGTWTYGTWNISRKTLHTCTPQTFKHFLLPSFPCKMNQCRFYND